MLFIFLIRKQQQGSIESAVIWVSVALSQPLSAQYLQNNDGMLGRRALQQTLVPRPAQPAGLHIRQDILQDCRGVEEVKHGGRRGQQEQICNGLSTAGWTANMQRERKRGCMQRLPLQGNCTLKTPRCEKTEGRASELDIWRRCSPKQGKEIRNT